MRVEPHEVAAPANVDVDFGPVGQGDVDHRVSARWTRNAAAPLTSHGVQPQWIDRFWREAIAQQLDRSCTTAAVVARPENAARSAYFFQWQFAARANERRVSSHRVRFALTMTNDDCRTNDEIRTKNDARVPVRHRHTWISHSSFLIRASGLFRYTRPVHWFGRARLLILTLICLFWTGLIVLGHFLPGAPFLSAPWLGEQSFEDLLRREGRKTAAPRDFVFLGIDQSTLQLPPLTAEEVAGSRAFQLMTERPFPWSREVWALLLDRLFGAGARLVVFDLLFNPPNDGDPAFHAALDRYHDKVVVGANFEMEMARRAVTPNDALIPPPQLQDDRVGFLNFWPDPIDGKVRAVAYRVTNRELAGLPSDPSEEIYESLSARALTKLGRANDVPGGFHGDMIRFTAQDAFEPRPLYEVFDPKF